MRDLRLQSRLQPEAGVRRALADERLRPLRARLGELLEAGETGLRHLAPPGGFETVQRLAFEIADLRRRERPVLLRKTAHGDTEPVSALAALDAMRWIDRLGYHAWRICNYLGGEGKPEPSPAAGRALPDG